MSTEGQPLDQVFADLGVQMRRARVVRGLCAWLACVAAAVLVLCGMDALLRLPAALRLALALGAAGGAAHLAWRWIIVPLRTPIDAVAAALAAERVAGRDDNRWVNAVQLAPAALPRGMRFFAAHHRGVAAGLAIPRAALLGRRPLLLAVSAAGVTGVLWTAVALAAPQRVGTSLVRFLAPLADVPAAGSVVLRLDPAGTKRVPRGGDLAMHLTVEGTASAPPRLIWAEGAERAPEDAGGAGTELVALTADGPGRWRGTLAGLQRGGALRALCGDAATASVRIEVVPPPVLTRSRWIVTPPALLGEAPRTLPGPPASPAVPAGATVMLEVACTPPADGMAWTCGPAAAPLAASDGVWRGSVTVTEPLSWALTARTDLGPVDLGRGQVDLEPDRPPEVTLSAGAETALTRAPATDLDLVVQAGDDHGLADLVLVGRDASGGEPRSLRTWTLAGPPGPREQRLTHRLVLDPAVFLPGHAYVLMVQAHDQRRQEGASSPLLVRIRAVEQVAAGDPADAGAVEALKEAVARQRTAIGLADNLKAQAGAVTTKARDAIAGPQGRVTESVRRARDGFRRSGDAAASVLDPLLTQELPALAAALAALPSAPRPAEALTALRSRQDYVLARLLHALGVAAEATPKALTMSPGEASQLPDPTVTARALEADLDGAVRAQERILARTRNLLAENPADLSSDQDEVKGALAREQAELAAFLQEKMSDFSKLPPQDASDMSLVKDGEAVYQEMSKAAGALAQQGKKATEFAVSGEKAALEAAKSLQHNLERWLASAPDTLQWKMEDQAKASDVPLAELPRELEDIVGDLIDSAEKMDESVEDVSSNHIDSMDKGAGWGTGDGPIANMSAKGVTGNVLPNQHEIGGRSGEGRSGRSSGQMVADEAEGKGGRETPTRLSPGAFEQGSVKDKMQGSAGGATGGGKVSGGDGEGLRGPVPPQLQQAMQRLAGNHAQLQQQAGEVALRLRAQHAGSPELETAAAALGAAARAASAGDAIALRQRHDQAVEALRAARSSAIATGTARERIDLRRQESGITSQAGERVPPGYEALVQRYYQALAEGP